MKDTKLIIGGIAALLAIIIVGIAIFALTRGGSETNTTNTETQQTSQVQKVAENSESKTEVNEGPVAFSKIEKGILDAREDYKYFTFENGAGTCMDQGFPKDMVYDSENLMKTQDGSYIEESTAVDFLGNIRFDEVPLKTGNATCVITTANGSDSASLNCSLKEVSVCTSTFSIFGNN